MNSDQPELVAWWESTWADEDMLFVCEACPPDEIREFGRAKTRETARVGSEPPRRVRRPKVGIAMEGSRGGLIYALMQHEFLVSIPSTPEPWPNIGNRTCVSGAKDDPSDAALLLDLIVRHRDRSGRGIRIRRETRKIQLLCEHRRQW